MVELQWGIVGVNLVPRLVPGFRDKARVDGVVFRSTSEIVGKQALLKQWVGSYCLGYTLLVETASFPG